MTEVRTVKVLINDTFGERTIIINECDIHKYDCKVVTQKDTGEAKIKQQVATVKKKIARQRGRTPTK